MSRGTCARGCLVLPYLLVLMYSLRRNCTRTGRHGTTPGFSIFTLHTTRHDSRARKDGDDSLEHSPPLTRQEHHRPNCGHRGNKLRISLEACLTHTHTDVITVGAVSDDVTHFTLSTQDSQPLSDPKNFMSGVMTLSSQPASPNR